MLPTGKIRKITMKTINVYEFNELNDEAKEKAINHFCDINVDYEWWEGIYEDANETDIKITGFEMDRYCNIELYDTLFNTMNKIMQCHGKMCDTHKLAEEYSRRRNDLVYEFGDGDTVFEDNEGDFDRAEEELDEEYTKFLAEEYRIMLIKEYDYLTSEEAIIETIECN